MTRKITDESIQNFLNGWNFRKSNMEVINDFHYSDKNDSIFVSKLFLHGNCIAKRKVVNGKEEIEISNAGWFSNTTKERLNGIPGVSIYQKNFTWYLNGKEWDGNWIFIS